MMPSTLTRLSGPLAEKHPQSIMLSPPFLGSQPRAFYKDRVVLHRRCKDCKFVRRKGRQYIICKTHPRHKQRKI
uniref:Ribosomal protein n=1 Tax=Eptatretus burgeri TaxID=7764 RepID=A0A8C4R5Q6_EPTBU